MAWSISDWQQRAIPTSADMGECDMYCVCTDLLRGKLLFFVSWILPRCRSRDCYQARLKLEGDLILYPLACVALLRTASSQLYETVVMRRPRPSKTENN